MLTGSLLCSDATLWKVPAGVPSGLNNGCPQGSLRRFRGQGVEHQAGGSDPSVPYLISPRYTFVSDEHPTFRWNAVEGASFYLVRLQGPGIDWQTETRSNQIAYSGSTPLQPGVKYLVTVEADNGASSLEDGGARLGFEVLDQEAAQSVQDRARQIANSSLSAQGKAIALAQLYSDFNLNAKAIETLEALVAQGSQTPYVYQQLGDLYAQAGLNAAAQVRYQSVIALASTNQNLAIRGQAQAGLAGVMMALGKEAEAERLISQARAAYQAIGDFESARQLDGSWMAQTTASVQGDRLSLRGGRTDEEGVESEPRTFEPSEILTPEFEFVGIGPNY